MSSNNSGSNKGLIGSTITFLFLALICCICYYYFKAHSISGEEAGNIAGQIMISVGHFISEAGKAIAGWLPSPNS